MASCPKCGTKLDADDDFCPDCGTKISGATTKQEPVYPSQGYAAKPKRHGFFWFIVIVVIILFLIRACASFSSSLEPKIPPYDPERAKLQEASANERIISIKTPPPKVNPVEPEPFPPKLDKYAECSGAVAKITDACEMSGWNVYDYFTVANTGSTPILGFIARYYTNAMNKDETRLFEPLDVGAKHQYYSYYGGIKMIEIVPIIFVNGEEIVCDNNAVSYGNAYSEGFPACPL